MSIISQNIVSLSESQSLAMAQRVATLRERGVNVINMTLGEPDFDTPLHIKEAAIKAVQDNFSHYGPVKGLLSLREAISHKLATENQLHYTPDEIIVSVGAKQAICNTILTLINPNDEVIIPTPSWVSYSEMVKIAGGKNVFVKTSSTTDYKLTAEQLKATITEKTKLLILCSPNNPTGSVYSHDELASLVAVIQEHPNLYIISDEVYEKINYLGAHASLASFPEIAERVCLVNGVSKAYAMTGYRIGWMACHNKDIIKAYTILQGQYLTCACIVAQKAAEAAYIGDQTCVEMMCNEYKKRLNIITTALQDTPSLKLVEPQGAFYIFPDVSLYYGKSYNGKQICNSHDMINYLLEEAHVACVAGDAFGDDHCIRLSYALDEKKIIQAMIQIKEALKKLQ